MFLWHSGFFLLTTFSYYTSTHSLTYFTLNLMNILLIIDPQNDFITGSLAVPGAVGAMDYLTAYLQEHYAEYDAIVVTMDQHPADHCSFKENGGIWPIHCIRFTVGAAIYPPLADVIMECKRRGQNVLFIPKAMTRQKDAYSAFHDAVPDLLMHACHIDVAGLAGDYCVKCTIDDLKRLLYVPQIRPIEEAIAWIGEPHPLV